MRIIEVNTKEVKGKGKIVPRQRIRNVLLLGFMLLFPFTMNYYSFMLPVAGLAKGVACGALVVWLALFISSLILGRTFCSFLCPLGALQKVTDEAIGKNFKRVPYLQVVKYLLFAIWMSWLFWALTEGGVPHTLDLFYMTENITSWDSIHGNFIYGGVFGLVLLVALPLGRRAFCHYLCWYSPINMIGSTLGRVLQIPSLKLRSNGQCNNCGKCTDNCPMSLPVQKMQNSGDLNNIECILCGKCVDGCKEKAICYGWK